MKYRYRGNLGSKRQREREGCSGKAATPAVAASLALDLIEVYIHIYSMYTNMMYSLHRTKCRYRIYGILYVEYVYGGVDAKTYLRYTECS